MLLSATIIWGSSFFILKNVIDAFPTFFVLGFRFSMAVGIMGLVFVKKVITINKTTFLKGALLGVILAIAYCLQTIGLKNTTPSKNAFLTSTYCILVPFISWILFKQKPNVYNVIAGILCIAGIGLVSLSADFDIQFGDVLTLLCSIFFSLQLIFISRFAEKEDMVQLLIVELLISAIIFWIISFFSENDKYPVAITFTGMLPILYLTIFGTVIAQMFQMYGQKATSANEASLILSLEAVFGAIFSVIFYHEIMTLKLYAGFSVIFVALIISESKLEFLRKGIDKWKIKSYNKKDKHLEEK